MTELASRSPGGHDPLALQALETWPAGVNASEPFMSKGYTVEDLVHVFGVIYLNGGNMTRAHEQLQEQGWTINIATLGEWMRRYPARYAHVGQVMKDVAEQGYVAKLLEGAVAAQHVAQQAMELELERIREGKVKDASAVTQRMATSAAIFTDKYLALTGRPQAIVQHQSGMEILRQLEQFKQVVHVESTAEELPSD